MESAARPTTTDLTAVEQLQLEASEYNFFQLVELLETLKQEQGFDVLYSASSSLGFAPADVAQLAPIASSPGKYSLETSFLGLNGAQSPLPNYYLDELAAEHDGGVKQRFFDFFNHRLVELFHQVWRKYRYYVQFQPDASDQFSDQLFALVGLASPDMRGDTPINWCKMLAYSGMLAGKSRSPQVVAGIVAHCFDLSHVTVESWQLRHVPVPEEQRCLLGKQGVSLGIDTVIGNTVADRSGKFVLRISELSDSRFRDFLPTGKEYHALCKLIEFVLREQLAYDLVLEFAPDQITPMQLGGQGSAWLGWSAFVGQVSPDRSVVIQVRS